MALKLPRLSPLMTVTQDRASTPFCRFWDTVASAIEGAVDLIDSIVLQVDGLTRAVPTLAGDNEFTGFNQFDGEPNSLLGYQVAGLQVIGPRQTGWMAGTGTPNKGAFNGDTTHTYTGSYVQATAQATQDDLLAARQRILALEQAMRTHGLIV